MMKKDTIKLYRVNLKGPLMGYEVSYVAAKDPTKAYGIVKGYLDRNMIGFRENRELVSIELVAEESSDKPNCMFFCRPTFYKGKK